MASTPLHPDTESSRQLAQFKAALDEHSIVATTDTHGVITYVNDKFCEISKYSRPELLGQSHRLINSGQHPPEFFHGLWQMIASGRVWKGEICNRAKDGHLYWVETTIVPFMDATGHPCEYIAIRTDITMRKRQQEEIVRLLEAKLSNTLKALEGILPICAHCKDIRDTEGYWIQMEEYITRRSKANFSHGICPTCMRKHYPDIPL